MRTALTPRGDGLRDARLLAPERRRALDPPPGDVGIDAPVGVLAQQLALARRPPLAPTVLQAVVELEREREQVLDVGRGVLAHRG